MSMRLILFRISIIIYKIRKTTALTAVVKATIYMKACYKILKDL